jgi:hypothetical protein
MSRRERVLVHRLDPATTPEEELHNGVVPRLRRDPAELNLNAVLKPIDIGVC